MREAQRKRSEEARAAAEREGGPVQQQTTQQHSQTQQQGAAQQAQANVQAASQRASAYLSSWGSWAAEKRKQGWRAAKPVETPLPAPAKATDEKVSVEERPHVTTVSELQKAGNAENDAASAPASGTSQEKTV